MELKICDTHNDFLTALEFSKISDYIKNCKACGVENICASYWSTKRDESKIEDELSKFAFLLKEEKFFLHIEDLWWVKNEGRLENLLKIKPFSCSLTWNEANCLASGSAAFGGLTDWGRKCVQKLIDCKIVVDVAHLNRQSFFEVAKIVGENIYCSHTGFYGVKRHARNLTDAQIETIVKSGGFIGLFLFDKCIQKRKIFCVEDVAESLSFFKVHWGTDNIGLGTDFFGIENCPKDLKNYSDFKNLAKKLQENGFSEGEINKIFCQNFKNFCLRLNKKF